jgi:hypothetical protein
MEFAHILLLLWRRKRWLSLVVVIAFVGAIVATYRVSFSPPGLHGRAHQLGAASAQFVVDTQKSALVDVSGNLVPLSAHASVLAQFMQNTSMISQIAERAHIPATEISATGPLSATGSGTNSRTPAQVRAAQVASVSQRYSLWFSSPDPTTGLPLVSVYGQAPTASEAVRLVNAAITSASDYATTQASQTGVTVRNRLIVRQLGPARGGLVGSGATKAVTAVVFVGIVLLGCLLILFLSSITTRMRELRSAEDERSTPLRAPEAAAHANGAVDDAIELVKASVGSLSHAKAARSPEPASSEHAATAVATRPEPIGEWPVEQPSIAEQPETDVAEHRRRRNGRRRAAPELDVTEQPETDAAEQPETDAETDPAVSDSQHPASVAPVGHALKRLLRRGS